MKAHLSSGAHLRDPRPGDMGWVIQQHGELYWREYGWNAEFEALVTGIVAGMMKRHDPTWERGWIAELNCERVGSAFVVRKSKTVAQLRLLRDAIGFLSLLPFVWRPLRAPPWPAGTARPPGRDLLAMAALGVGQFALLIALLNLGLQHVGAARAALIFSLFPLLTQIGR